MATQIKHLFSFGALADIQYADRDDGHNFQRTKIRFYRNAENLLKDALAEWKKRQPSVTFVLQLGDLIDGVNKRTNNSEAALNRMLAIFQDLPVPTYPIIGNHDLYNFQHSDLIQSALFDSVRKLPQNNSDTLQDGRTCYDINEPSGYYSFEPCSQYRIICLDCYDFGVPGQHVDSPQYLIAKEILLQNNSNNDLNSPEGLHGCQRRFVQYNGGVGEKQLQWLRKELQLAESKDQKVIVCGHNPIFVESSDPQCLCWNYEEILDILHSHNNVVMYMCGHDHDGGYAIDKHGIHHVTFPGIIETPPELNAYVTIDVFTDRIEMCGLGCVETIFV
ncbi:manganese-dependent ADP-ribose/CDP-alcohol diphosphatase [Lingula anatina]|uniref:Manganese-dependent ADP-ribose/CDP-alcohol diphosphatase n=1 Tax=Lingula anatina TaxID=7574 RepID=A0A1S3I8K0_LINAN|nr:manganese-dependent ADP-ribose/CDP-alcohol diphosphatase [Lingula anatina]|eukprot:XP_013393714.1 manganese-dependent ADP-ribose/CDP-alcohol diphosphatase [Lingula anatina]